MLGEKGAFARQRLEGIFGDSLPEVVSDLQAGAVTIKSLAQEKNIKPSTLATWLRRAESAPGIPPAEEPASGITIFDLVDVNGDWQITKSILKKFKSLNLSPQKVAAGSDKDLKELGFTDEEISYMREQLRRSH